MDSAGTDVQGMDVDVVLARHPEVAVVDEFAHTDAGSVRKQGAPWIGQARRYGASLLPPQRGLSF